MRAFLCCCWKRCGNTGSCAARTWGLMLRLLKPTHRSGPWCIAIPRSNTGIMSNAWRPSRGLIRRTKDGATDMIYKPETVVDLDTGAIVQAEVQLGDKADHKDMSVEILEAQQNINRAAGEKLDTLTVRSATSDKGYYAVGELQTLQGEGIRTVISDPIDNRRLDKLEPAEKRAVLAARRSVKSKSGKELLRRRGMHIERSFAHILDCGGLRRTTLRGWENLNKRYKLAAAFYNLSQLMRKLFGFGTPKQLAAFGRLLFIRLTWLLALPSLIGKWIGYYASIWIRQFCTEPPPILAS